MQRGSWADNPPSRLALWSPRSRCECKQKGESDNSLSVKLWEIGRGRRDPHLNRITPAVLSCKHTVTRTPFSLNLNKSGNKPVGPISVNWSREKYSSLYRRPFSTDERKRWFKKESGVKRCVEALLMTLNSSELYIRLWYQKLRLGSDQPVISWSRSLTLCVAAAFVSWCTARSTVWLKIQQWYLYLGSCLLTYLPTSLLLTTEKSLGLFSLCIQLFPLVDLG